MWKINSAIIAAVSILVILLVGRRSRKQPEEQDPLLVELEEIAANNISIELTDAVNRTHYWAQIGDYGVVADILETRQAKQYADRLGLELIVPGEEHG